MGDAEADRFVFDLEGFGRGLTASAELLLFEDDESPEWWSSSVSATGAKPACSSLTEDRGSGRSQSFKLDVGFTFSSFEGDSFLR